MLPSILSLLFLVSQKSLYMQFFQRENGRPLLIIAWYFVGNKLWCGMQHDGAIFWDCLLDWEICFRCGPVSHMLLARITSALLRFFAAIVYFFRNQNSYSTLTAVIDYLRHQQNLLKKIQSKCFKVFTIQQLSLGSVLPCISNYLFHIIKYLDEKYSVQVVYYFVALSSVYSPYHGRVQHYLQFFAKQCHSCAWAELFGFAVYPISFQLFLHQKTSLRQNILRTWFQSICVSAISLLYQMPT